MVNFTRAVRLVRMRFDAAHPPAPLAAGGVATRRTRTTTGAFPTDRDTTTTGRPTPSSGRGWRSGGGWVSRGGCPRRRR